MKKSQKTYLILSGVALGFSVVCAVLWDLFNQNELLPILKILSDCFSIPGLLFICVSVLGWVSSKGGFDIFGYSAKSFFNLFKRESYYNKPETYYDYRAKKEETRKPFNLPMCLVGVTYLVIGVIIMVVFLVFDK